jgi:hypothetical protein
MKNIWTSKWDYSTISFSKAMDVPMKSGTLILSWMLLVLVLFGATVCQAADGTEFVGIRRAFVYSSALARFFLK